MINSLKQGKKFYKQLIWLSMPLVLQNLINHSLQLADAFMVSSLGERELAAVTLANTPFFIIMMIVFGLMSGSGILFSQYWGNKDIKTINRIIGVGFYVSGSLTMLLAVVMMVFPNQVMALTTNDPELIEFAVKYARIVALSYFFNSLTSQYIAMQRSMENVKFGMYLLGFSTIVNTVLNWIFIYGNLGAPRMGVEGAALGTLLARILEFAVALFYALKVSDFKLNWKLIARPGKIIAKDFFKYCIPVVLNEMLWGIGFSLYPIILGHMANASVIVAAFSLTGNIDRVLAVSLFALSGSSAIIIGKEIGAKSGLEKVQSIAKALIYVSVFAGIMIGITLAVLNAFIISPYLIPLFALPNAGSITKVMLYISSIALPFRAYNLIGIVGLLRGGGDVKMSLIIDIIPMYFLAIPIAAFAGLVLNENVIVVYIIMQSEEIIKSFIISRRIKFPQRWIKNITREDVDLQEISNARSDVLI